MRMMMRITIPVEAGNKAVKDGSLPKALQLMMGELKPEAAYFTPIDGVRTALIFFDMKDVSDIPRMVEPLFQGFNAAVEFSPAMNADDLKAGLEKVKP